MNSLNVINAVRAAKSRALFWARVARRGGLTGLMLALNLRWEHAEICRTHDAIEAEEAQHEQNMLELRERLQHHMERHEGARLAFSPYMDARLRQAGHDAWSLL